MAVWQFDVQLIPRGAPTPLVGADGIEVEPCWEGFSTEVDIKGRLTQHFGAAREVLPNWFQWGQEQGNRIDAGFEGTRLTSLSARLDPRTEYDSFLHFLCELATAIDCQFFAPEFRSRINPNPAELRGELSQSRAALWTTSPIAVLERAKREHDAS